MRVRRRPRWAPRRRRNHRLGPGDRIPGVTDGAPHRAAGRRALRSMRSRRRRPWDASPERTPARAPRRRCPGPADAGGRPWIRYTFPFSRTPRRTGRPTDKAAPFGGCSRRGASRGKAAASGAAAGGPSPEAGIARQADAAGAARLASAEIAGAVRHRLPPSARMRT